VDRERRPAGRREGRVAHDLAVEGRDRRHAFDDEFVEDAAGPLQGLLAGAAGDDELGDHRVEGAGDGVALDDPGVPAHTRTLGNHHLRDGAWRGQEAAARRPRR
jgi:hypothetical protein